MTRPARLLAIDPGNTESAYVIVDAHRRPLAIGKVPNHQLLDILSGTDDGPPAEHFAIEMVASYGMPVGADVFETCVWIGRFQQTIEHWAPTAECDLIKRQPVKLHHCHSSKAKDSNISQALVDRFAPNVGNRGKGTKAEPGWFYGFHSDIWQAYALAVYAADMLLRFEEPQTSVLVPDPQGEGGNGTGTDTHQEALL